MIEETAIKIIHALADLKINVAAGLLCQEAGPPDWGVMVPSGQAVDMTDVVGEMNKLGVRVKVGEDGTLQFWPPPTEMPENAEEVEEEVWGERTSCIKRTPPVACSHLPCEVCGNAAEDWVDLSSIDVGTGIDIEVFTRFGLGGRGAGGWGSPFVGQR